MEETAAKLTPVLCVLSFSKQAKRSVYENQRGHSDGLHCTTNIERVAAAHAREERLRLGQYTLSAKPEQDVHHDWI